MRRTAVVAGLIVLAATFASPAHASAESRANDLAGEIMSPFCPGVTLHECPSAEAVALRDQIETWFAAGWTSNEILRELEAEYGTGIRAAPPPSGGGLVVWLLPALALAAGVALVWFLLRRWVVEPPPATVPTPVSDSERVLIEQELATLRSSR